MGEKSLIEAIGPFLSRFSKKGNKYNFRCVYCGDSKRDETKARAWLLPPRRQQGIDTYVYHCFNCNKSTTLEKFLKENFPDKYDALLLDKYSSGAGKKMFRNREDLVGVSEPHEFNEKLTESLQRVSSLSSSHPCVEYCRSRQIPKKYWSDLWYAEEFEPWIETILPERNQYKKVSSRLVFPLRTRAGNVFGVQGRTISGDRIRYKTFVFVENRTQVYGLETVNFNETFYVLEGIIDSFFVENSIAVGSSSLVAGLRSLRTIEKNAVLVFDNQPKNPEIVHCLRGAVSEGYKVCIWPKGLKGKDPNEMIQSGVTQEDLMTIIRQNTFSGLAAETELIGRKLIKEREEVDRRQKRKPLSGRDKIL